MTLPNPNDFDEFEFTRYDIIFIILNFIGYFILGWERTMYVFIASVLAWAFIVFIMICIKWVQHR